MLDKFNFLSHSLIFTLIKDFAQNNFSKRKTILKIVLKNRFDQFLVSELKNLVCAIKANLSSIQFRNMICISDSGRWAGRGVILLENISPCKNIDDLH